MKFINSFVWTVIVWTATATIALSQTTTPESDQNANGLATASIKVKGLTCATDVKTISANVEKVQGVSSCKAGKQGPTTTFEVRYNPAIATEKDIFAAIEDTGGCENPDDRPYKIKQ
jgi:copper chaperone CopZ